jgi:hypothetical protein
LAEGGAYGVVTVAQKLSGDVTDNLVKACAERNELPRRDELLQVVTGRALEEIIPRLNALAQSVAEVEAKKRLLKTRQAEIRAMLQEGGLARLREEAKALRTELEQMGVLNKKVKGKPAATAPGPG